MEKTKKRFFLSVFVQDLLAVPLAKVCIRARVHPNFVTAAGLLSALFCAFAFLNGKMYLGALLYFAAMVLDSTDGRVARGLGISSRLGMILDTIADKTRSIVAAMALIVGVLGPTLNAIVMFGLYISVPLLRLAVSLKYRPTVDPMEIYWYNTRFASWLESANVCGFYMGWERAAAVLVLGPLTGFPMIVLVLAVLMEALIFAKGLVHLIRTREA